MKTQNRKTLLKILNKYQEEIIEFSADWIYKKTVNPKGKTLKKEAIKLSTELFFSNKDVLISDNYTKLNKLINYTVEHKRIAKDNISKLQKEFLSFVKAIEPIFRKECKESFQALEMIGIVYSLYEYSIFKMSDLYQELIIRKFKKQTVELEYIDNRIEQVLDIIQKVARGNYRVACTLSKKNDIFDALGIGINMLIDDTKSGIEKIERGKKNLNRRIKERTLELENERNKFQAIIEGISDGILVINAKSNIIMVNPSSERLLGIKKSQVVGKHVLDCLEDIKILDLITRRLESGDEYYSKELIITNRETGMERVLNGRISSVLTRTGKGLGAVIVLRDITKEKEVDRMKTDFVSNVSHELRTPLASIKGFVSTLIETEVTEDERKEFLTIVDQESDRLNQLIEDLLDLSRIESGKIRLNFNSVNILEIIKRLEIEVSNKIKKKKIFFKIDVSKSLPMVKADENALLQILVNLVSNAIKFIKKGGIWIKVKQWDKGKYIKFSIQDTGIGIGKRYLEKIFEKFYRIEAIAHTIPGTGLGLAIAKDLVEKHEGKIWVESEVRKGTTFYFTIPVFAEKKK